MQIALIRHLPTSWNDKGYLQGKRDIAVSFPLAETVQAEVEENRSRLQEWEPFDGVFASALQRTQQTARVYGYHAPLIEPLLNEFDFGPYEGKPRERFLAHFHNTWRNEPLRIELGEPMYKFQQRIIRFIHRYIHLKKVLVFGHGCWIRALISIARTGNSNLMNQLTVKNNECIFLSIAQERMLSWVKAMQY